MNRRIAEKVIRNTRPTHRTRTIDAAIRKCGVPFRFTNADIFVLREADQEFIRLAQATRIDYHGMMGIPARLVAGETIQ